MCQLGIIPFNLFINDLDDGIEYTCSGIRGHTKLAGENDALGSCANIPRDLDRLEV